MGPSESDDISISLLGIRLGEERAAVRSRLGTPDRSFGRGQDSHPEETDVYGDLYVSYAPQTWRVRHVEVAADTSVSLLGVELNGRPLDLVTADLASIGIAVERHATDRAIAEVRSWGVGFYLEGDDDLIASTGIGC